MNRLRKSIVYVNFSPYDNAGYILDHLVKSYSLVIHFSFDHLRLRHGRNTNILTIYQYGKQYRRIKLMSSRAPQPLLFISLPLVGLLMIIQTLFYVIAVKNTFGTPDYFFTVNGFPAWIGNSLKRLRLIHKTVFWVWDFYPGNHPSKRIRIIRLVYWYFDMAATKRADVLLFPNRRLITLRQKYGYLSSNSHYSLMPIGTKVDTQIKPRNQKSKNIIIGHLGMLKWEQGLDMILDHFNEIQEQFPQIRLEIIGSGPEEEELKHKAQAYKSAIKFYGYVAATSQLHMIIRSWTLGLATYVPHASNPSFWTDPSKVKVYLSQGVPVVTTRVPDIWRVIMQTRSGVVIPYGDIIALKDAIKLISKNRMSYSKNALLLTKKYDYTLLYKKIHDY